MKKVIMLLSVLMMAQVSPVMADSMWSRFGGSVALYQTFDQNEAEFGAGPVFIGTLHYEAGENWKIEYIHKSYVGTGRPFNDGECGPDSHKFCESTFDAIGIKYEF